MFKTYEIRLPDQTWKKYTLSAYSSIAELATRLGSEMGFDGNDYNMVHRGTILDKARQLQHYVATIPNNGRIEFVPVVREALTPAQQPLPPFSERTLSTAPSVRLAIDIEKSDVPEISHLSGRMVKTVPSSYTLWQCLLHPVINQDPHLSTQLSQDLESLLLLLDDVASTGRDDKRYHAQLVYVRNAITGRAQLSATTLQQLNVHGGSARMLLRFVLDDGTVTSEDPVPHFAKPSCSRSLTRTDPPPSSDTASHVKKQKMLPPSPTQLQVKPISSRTDPKVVVGDVSSHSLDNFSQTTQPPFYAFRQQPSTMNRENLARVVPMDATDVQPLHPLPPNAPPELPPIHPPSSISFTPSSCPIPPSPSTSASYVVAPRVVERKAVYYYPEDKPPRTDQSDTDAAASLPDSFFDVTLEDVRSMMADLTRKRITLENEPLKTTAMLKFEERVRLARYPRTLVRIIYDGRSGPACMNDDVPSSRVVLQAIFGTRETLDTLYTFVRANVTGIRHPILFTTPPKKVLADTAFVDLFHSQLYPSAIVHLSAGGGSGPNVPPPPLTIGLPLVSQAEAEATMVEICRTT